MKFTVIITAHNEENEVRDTVASIRATTRGKYEVVIVDDASTDGCCEGVVCDEYLRHTERLGVGPSRLAGAAKASGDCLIFIDAHHRFSDGCLTEIADVALEYKAITTPCVGGFDYKKRLRGHGFFMSTSRDEKLKKGIVGVHWNGEPSRDRIVRCYGANVPYAIPRSVFDIVKWSSAAAGYGGNEASVSVRAWFAEIDFLHVCGPWARHLYRRESPFEHPWDEWWRSHALTARICFAESTWRNYWLPKVFAGKIDATEMEREPVTSEHAAFQQLKKRSDVDFFRGLFHEPVPEGVTE